MPSVPIRVALGFLAGALSVLTFHAAMWEALHVLALPHLEMPPAWPTGPVPPLMVPRLASMAFWGGLYGILFGLLLPVLPRPLWASGLLLGLLAVLVGFFVVPLAKGLPFDAFQHWNNWVRSGLINGFWGLGVGLILPLLLAPAGRQARFT